MRTWLVLVALLVAGCSQPPAQDVDVPPTPAPHAGELPIAVDAFIASPTECLPVAQFPFCVTGYGPTVLLATPTNATVRSLAIHLGPEMLLTGESPVDDDVAYQILCQGDRACSRPLAEGVTKLPTDLAVQDLDLEPGTQIHLQLTVQGRSGYVDFGLENGRQSAVTGTAQVEWLPAVAPALRDLTIDVHGHTGPCDLQANCTGWPGGSRFELPRDVVALHLTMTWDAPTPLEASLRLGAAPMDCDNPCPAPVQASGPSPLRLNATGLAYDGVTLRVAYADPTDGPLGTPPYGTRTPIHITGTVTVLDD